MPGSPKIAILADFPVWYVRPEVPQRDWHHAVWLVAMYEAFAQQSDYEIHWLTFCREVERTRRFESGGQFFHVFPGGSLRLADYSGFFLDRLRAARELRHIAPDAVHAWGTESRYAVCALTYQAPRMLSMQGVLTAIHERCPLSGYMRRRMLWERQNLRRFSLVTAESDWAVERCRAIAEGVPVHRWEYAPQNVFAETQRCPSPEPMCLMAGSDIPLKNVRLAIDAFSRPELQHVTLLLAGVEPGAHPELPANIRALGGVPHERMPELLSREWCLIHPSLADSSPNIIKEARVMGLPVVTTPDCGGKQYVAEGKSGFVVGPRDVEAMVRAVLCLTESRESSLRMGAYGLAECRRLLSPETMMVGLKRLYGELLLQL